MELVVAVGILLVLYGSLCWLAYRPKPTFEVPTSKAQLKLADQLGVSRRAINYHSCGYYIDIALFSRKIAVEYNGRIWHPDHKKDYERARRLTKCGWKVLLIYADNGELPSMQELSKHLDKLEKGSRKIRTMNI